MKIGVWESEIINLSEIITKYKKRKTSHGVEKYPAGGKDVHKLCELVRHLEQIIRNLQHELPVEKKNIVERAISTAYLLSFRLGNRK